MPGPAPHRLCVQWPRLGPYHLARLRAAHERFTSEGWDVVAVETAGDDATYAWRLETAPEPFQREQVFPSGVVEGLAPRAVHRELTRLLDRLQPDAVAVNSYSAPDAQAALTWTRRNRRVAVCMMESTARDAPRSPLRERAKGAIVRAFDAALAGGTPQRDYLRQLGFDDAFVFEPYDVVDNAHFERIAAGVRAAPEATRHLPGLGDGPFFLASSRFVARKNLMALLDAYARYRAADDAPWRLVLLGDGPERDRLERRARAIGGVTFAGFQQYDVLPVYFARAQAFVHPPLVEPWGLVVNEALASGTPVLVSSHVGASTDLVRDGVTGYRFNPHDVGGLASLLGSFAARTAADREAMGRAGQEIVAAWSPEQFADGLWRAVEAGTHRAGRRPSFGAQGLLWAQRTVSRDARSFHTLRD